MMATTTPLLARLGEFELAAQCRPVRGAGQMQDAGSLGTKPAAWACILPAASRHWQTGQAKPAVVEA